MNTSKAVPSNHTNPSVKIMAKDSGITIESTFQILYKKKDNGHFICSIPEFNIYFTAADKESVVKKGDVYMDIFVGHFFDSGSKFALRKFAVNLHRLGFKSQNNPSAMVNLMRNKPDRNTNFKIANAALPNGFDMASKMERSTSFAAQA